MLQYIHQTQGSLLITCHCLFLKSIWSIKNLCHIQIIYFADETHLTHQKIDPIDPGSLGHPTHFQPWCEWISSFLSKPTQYVRCSGHISIPIDFSGYHTRSCCSCYISIICQGVSFLHAACLQMTVCYNGKLNLLKTVELYSVTCLKLRFGLTSDYWPLMQLNVRYHKLHWIIILSQGSYYFYNLNCLCVYSWSQVFLDYSGL